MCHVRNDSIYGLLSAKLPYGFRNLPIVFRTHMSYNRAMVNIGNDWDEILAEEFQKEYYQRLREFLVSEYRGHMVYPGMHDIFNALKSTPYYKVKAVILGQDPYHEPGQAHGMAFSF